MKRLGAGPRAGITIAVLLLVAIIAITILDRATQSADRAGEQSAPRSTADNGLAAWIELLRTYGHDVSVRSAEGLVTVDSDATIVVLDRDLDASATYAVAAHLTRGGRLVAGGSESTLWLDRTVDSAAPTWSPSGATRATPVGSLPGIDGISEVTTDGLGSWRELGDSEAILRGDANVIASVGGNGDAVLLADTSMLDNRHLDEADNAAFSLQIVSAGPVVIVEPAPTATGFAAVPTGWKYGLVGLGLAFVLGAIAGGRRLGPPERSVRELAPARRRYVDALADSLGRTSRQALEPLRRHARTAILRRAALPSDTSDADLDAAARRLGIPDDERSALTHEPRTDDDVLALGRVTARIEGDSW